MFLDMVRSSQPGGLELKEGLPVLLLLNHHQLLRAADQVMLGFKKR
jgi:hypothetical protein